MIYAFIYDLASSNGSDVQEAYRLIYFILWKWKKYYNILT